MRPLPVLLAIPVCVLLSACDGRACGSANIGEPVYVEVTYERDGTPKVVPETCTVKLGTDVTWRGPWFDNTPFELVFDAPPGMPLTGASRGTVFTTDNVFFRHRVKIKTNAEGKFKYDVQANSKTLDPHVIIEK